MSTIDTIAATLAHGVNRNDITIGNVINVVVDLMQRVAKYKTLTGKEKKIAVTQALMILVSLVADESNEHESAKKLLLEELLTDMLPTLIDTIVSIDGNKLVINPKTKKCLTTFICC